MATLNPSFLALTAAPNVVTEAGDFYVSYNSHDTSVYGSDTTALVWGQMERFYILDGDHRDAYADLIPLGWSACLDYFCAHVAQMNKLCDRLPGPDDLPRALPKPQA